MCVFSQCTGSSHCERTCASDDLHCYVLDNNGFVLISELPEHTGKFFGQIDGTIMDSLVQDRIYRRVSHMDYQGICSDRDNPYNAAGERINPVTPIHWLLKYAFTFLTTWISLVTKPVLAWPIASYTYEDEDMAPYDDYEQPDYNNPPDFDDHITHSEIEKVTPAQPLPPRIVSPANNANGPRERVVPDPAHARPCDLKTDLYLLQPDRLNQSGQSSPLKVCISQN